LTAKYTLREGTTEERRELLGCFKTKIVVREKKVTPESAA
jgi:hypothetical protein